MAKRRRPRLGSVTLAPPELAPYGRRGRLGDPETESPCPAPPGRRLAICQKQGRTTQTIAQADDVCRMLRNTTNADRESLYAIHLNAGNRVIGVEEIAKGTLTGVTTSPRELFKGAILNNAAAIILAHNHPSGNPDPSTDDFAMTHNVVAAGKLLGIPVLDHVVVASQGCVSLRERRAATFAGAAVSRKRRRR